MTKDRDSKLRRHQALIRSLTNFPVSEESRVIGVPESSSDTPTDRNFERKRTADRLRNLLREVNLTVREFNRRSSFGSKSFKRFVREICESNVKIEYDPKLCALVKISFRVAVQIRVPSENIAFREVGRIYPDGRESYPPDAELWTLSGTLNNREEMIDTIRREAEEETGLRLELSQIDLNIVDLRQYKQSERPSRVYHRVLSRVYVSVLSANLPRRPLDRNGNPWRDVMTFEDQGVTIKVRAFPCRDLPKSPFLF